MRIKQNLVWLYYGSISKWVYIYIGRGGGVYIICVLFFFPRRFSSSLFVWCCCCCWLHCHLFNLTKKKCVFVLKLYRLGTTTIFALSSVLFRDPAYFFLFFFVFAASSCIYTDCGRFFFRDFCGNVSEKLWWWWTIIRFTSKSRDSSLFFILGSLLQRFNDATMGWYLLLVLCVRCVYNL